MRHLDLCSGIGGFALGLGWAGFRTVGFAEHEPFPSKVLAHRWSDVPNFGDMEALNGDEFPDSDIWTAGFPCQPASVAGRRAGTEDCRWLWPTLARLVARRRPRWVLLENVPGLLTVQRGRAFGAVLADLAACGYVGCWFVLGAWQLGARHRRDRVWVVGRNLSDTGYRERAQSEQERWRSGPPRVGDDGEARAVADTYKTGCSEFWIGCVHDRERQTQRRHSDGCNGAGLLDWLWGWAVDPADVEHADQAGQAIVSGSQAESQCSGSGAVDSPGGRISQPLVGRVAHGIPHRIHRLAALGNAIVPQAAQWIGERILAIEAEELRK